MRFQVPQFIEVEDRIFGPLTLRQFIYLAGAVGLIVIIWAISPSFILTVILATPVAALGGALAFLKINNRPFILTLESAFYFLLSSRLYLWKKREEEVAPRENLENDGKQGMPLKIPTLSGNRLKALALDLETKDIVGSGKDTSKIK